MWLSSYSTYKKFNELFHLGFQNSVTTWQLTQMTIESINKFSWPIKLKWQWKIFTSQPSFLQQLCYFSCFVFSLQQPYSIFWHTWGVNIIHCNVGFEVFTILCVKIVLLWVVLQCSVLVYTNFSEEHAVSIFRAEDCSLIFIVQYIF
jgi:hypothetical protein